MKYSNISIQSVQFVGGSVRCFYYFELECYLSDSDITIIILSLYELFINNRILQVNLYRGHHEAKSLFV